jgi:hypothetical protein
MSSDKKVFIVLLNSKLILAKIFYDTFILFLNSKGILYFLGKNRSCYIFMLMYWGGLYMYAPRQSQLNIWSSSDILGRILILAPRNLYLCFKNE